MACVSLACIGVVAADSAGAANLVTSGRCQFYGPSNEFFDVPYAQYDDGIVDVQVDLYSNVPRQFLGTVATFHTRDYTVMPSSLCIQGGTGQASSFAFCNNFTVDGWPFYSWAYVYPYNVTANYHVDMVGYIGYDNGWWNVYSPDYMQVLVSGQGSWWIGDSRVNAQGNGGCIGIELT